MKVVVDTNIFVSALMGQTSASREIIRLCLQRDLQPLMGNALFAEYEDVISRDELFQKCAVSKSERHVLLDAFLSVSRWTSVYYLWRPNLRDEADNHLVELAVAGAASALITANVRDFLKPALLFPALEVCTAGEFLIKRKSS